MYDANLILLDNVTQTATFDGAILDLGAGSRGTPRRGLSARLRVGAVAGTSPTLAAKVRHSDDGTTFTDCAVFDPASMTASGVALCHFETFKRYVRVQGTIGGTSPSFVLNADIGASKP